MSSFWISTIPDRWMCCAARLLLHKSADQTCLMRTKRCKTLFSCPDSAQHGMYPPPTTCTQPPNSHLHQRTCLCLHVMLHVVLLCAHAPGCHMQLAEGTILHRCSQLSLLDVVVLTVPADNNCAATRLGPYLSCKESLQQHSLCSLARADGLSINLFSVNTLPFPSSSVFHAAAAITRMQSHEWQQHGSSNSPVLVCALAGWSAGSLHNSPAAAPGRF
jgi:hypothetical protein